VFVGWKCEVVEEGARGRAKSGILGLWWLLTDGEVEMKNGRLSRSLAAEYLHHVRLIELSTPPPPKTFFIKINIRGGKFSNN
jgi:hypothetical protein